MRLTLRTLLAYLDDTLEPLEIKTIGQKVAESETAQELIARIKQATRRRRITAPPATGPNSFDPNMVADYLDNELSSEQVAELEKICLESDVHLAEVASCHQILTLVLGEPASVPPTAKQRMYSLVQGREAIPFRKAAAAGAAASTPSSADHDADEMFLLGLPFYRRGSWLRWALPLAALVLFTVVGVALWQSIHGLQTQPSRPVEVADNGKPNPQPSETVKPPEKESEKTTVAVAQPTPDKTLANLPNNKDPKNPNGATTTEPVTPPERPPESKPSASPAVRQEPPNTERVKVGLYHTEGNRLTLLVQRKDASDDWHRLAPGKDVFSNDQLVSLPGYASEVWLDCGVHLLLRGHLREFTPPKQNVMDHLQESVVVLHKPKDTDADLTLLRGRLYFSNHKRATAVVLRLRFETNKVWDVTLQPGAEMVVDLIKARNAGQPLSLLNLLLLDGKAGIALENDQFPQLSPSGAAYFSWNNLMKPNHYDRRHVNPQDPEIRLVFAKTPIVADKDAEGMEQALAALHRRMTVDKSPLVALEEVLDNEKPYEHRLVIYCLAALDEVKELMNILGNADAVHAPDRFVAFVALRRWLDRGEEQSIKLYNPKTKKGLLPDLRYTPDEAEQILELLNDPSDEQIFKAETYERLAHDLVSDKVVIAELARWRLSLLSKFAGVPLRKLDNFNAAMPRADRAAAEGEVNEKLDEGLLPPRLNPRQPGSGAPKTPPKGSGTKR
jgi:hypothetical protein